MTRSLSTYLHLIAMQRLRLIVRGDAMPRENEPIDLMMLLVMGGDRAAPS